MARTITIGDSFAIAPVYAVLSDNSVIPLTGAKVEASVRVKATTYGGAALFTLQNTAAGGSDAEIAILDIPTGKIAAYITSTQSLTMTADTIYICEVRVKTATTALVYTVARAEWTARAAVTPVPTP